MNRQAYRWPMVIGLLGLMVLSYPFCQLLTPEWGWENGVLEWLQVLLLSVITILVIVFARGAEEIRVRHFWLIIAPIMGLLVLRELSWGAVLFPPVEVGSYGPQFLSRKELSYGDLIHPALGLFIIVWVFFVVKLKTLTVCFQLVKARRFPVVEIGLAMVAIILSSAVEQQVFSIGADTKIVFEEYLETLFYMGLLLTMIRMKYVLNAVSPVTNLN